MAAAAGDAAIDSHRRMLALLEDIERRTPRREPLHRRASGAARRARPSTRSAPDADPLERWRKLRDLGLAELDRANEVEAVAKLEEAVAMLPGLAGRVPDDEAKEARFRLGVAWLRRGESQNCALRHNAESCILPIRGAGIHVEQEGSRQAMRRFLELAADTAADRASSIHLKSVWLANIAAMTVGEYPDGVPESFRIPPEIFASDAPFPRFENVAPELGLAAFNLFGSAVADDFDGDGWIDLFTSTAHTSEQARLYRNNRDGTFTDVSDAANLQGINGGLNAVQADYDNDGDADVLVLRGAWLRAAGRHPKSLLRNDGHGRFDGRDLRRRDGRALLPDADRRTGPTTTTTATSTSTSATRRTGATSPTRPASSGATRETARSSSVADAGRRRHPRLRQGRGVGRLRRRPLPRSLRLGQRRAQPPVPQQPRRHLHRRRARGRRRRCRSTASRSGSGTTTTTARSTSTSRPTAAPPARWPRWRSATSAARPRSSSDASTAATATAASATSRAQTGLTRLHLAMGSNFGDLDNDGWLDFYLGTGYPDYEALMPNAMYRNDRGTRLSGRHLERRVRAPAEGPRGRVRRLRSGRRPGRLRADGRHLRRRSRVERLLPEPRLRRPLDRAPARRHALEPLRDRRAHPRRHHRSTASARSIHRWVTSGGSFGASPLRQSIGVAAATVVDRIEIYWPTSDTTQTFTAVAADRIYRVVEGEDAIEELELPPPPAAHRDRRALSRDHFGCFGGFR